MLCREKQKNPNCKECGLVKLESENHFVCGIIEDWLAILVVDGKISPEGLKFVLEVEEIPLLDRKDLSFLIISALKAGITAAKG